MMLHSVWPTLHNRGIAWKLIDVERGTRLSYRPAVAKTVHGQRLR